MDRRIFLQQIATGALLFAGCSKSGTIDPGPDPTPEPKKLLVLTQTTEYRHDTVTTAVATLRALGEESGKWKIAQQADSAAQVAEAITAENLLKVDAVVFANTTGILNFTSQGDAAFYQWINNGGAYIGIHSASDTFRTDPEYTGLLGGEFIGHGPQKEVTIFVQDPQHPACRNLPASFPFYDEIYEFKNWDRSRVHALLSMHEHPQTGAPGDFPIAWTRRHGEGRMFYTSLGHREDVFSNPLFRGHLEGGVLWALGLQQGNDTPGNPLL